MSTLNSGAKREIEPMLVNNISIYFTQAMVVMLQRHQSLH